MAVILREIREDDLEMIMNWRMLPEVTRYLTTEPKLTLETQKEWYHSIKLDETVRHWLIEVDGEPAGIINIMNMDWKCGTCSWGYYIANKALRSLKLAISLEMSLYDYIFDIIGFSELRSETFRLNEGVWKLHLACGSKIVKEVPGEIEKDGVFYDVVHMAITKDKWYSVREKKKYEKLDFDILPSGMLGLKLHHLGIAAMDAEKAVFAYQKLGWKKVEEIIMDQERGVSLAFMKHHDEPYLIELVSPLHEKSPVSQTLAGMKGVTTPYHICYEINDIERAVQILKKWGYIQTAALSPAIAFQGRRVTFFVTREGGLIELLESNRKD